MNKYYSPLSDYEIKSGRNIPLTSELVQALPEGFTLTGRFPNRRARRKFLNYSSFPNNRSKTNSRNVSSRPFLVQVFFDAAKNIWKKIVHLIQK